MNIRIIALAGLAGCLTLVGPLAADPAAATPSSSLAAGATLTCGNSLVAGGFSLNMQCDGNLVERDSAGNPVWTSRTNGPSDAYRLVMQTDGNLVIYRNATAIFATGTNISAGSGSDLELQTDGNAVVYAPGHAARWASKSRAEAAITWYYTRLGSTAYDSPTHRCETAVENSFGTSGQYLTATANWNNRVHRTPYTNAPRGTLVFYHTSDDGHVALSIGNGQVLSSSAASPRNALGVSPITGWFANPLGWDYAPWGTPW